MSLLSHEAAWKVAITAVVNAPTLTYDETLHGDECVRITVTRAVREEPRACGNRAILGFRLTTVCVSTTRHNVQMMRHDLTELQDKPLPAIDSDLLQPDAESDDPEQDDDGYWTALDSWLYFAPNPHH